MSIEKKQFPSGLTAYVDHMPEAQTTAVNVFVPFGSIDELPGQEGVAHALEHCVFLKTPDFPDKQAIDLHARLNGMDQNANTYYTRTLHETHGMSAEPAFHHLSEVLQHAEIPDKDAAHEMKAVRREAITGLDDVENAHAVSLDYAVFGSPYGRRVIGYHNALNFKGELLRSIYEQQYILGAMTVIIAGATPADEAYALLERYFDIDTRIALPDRPVPARPTFAGNRISGFVRPESSNVRISVAHPLTPEITERVKYDPTLYDIATSIMSEECFQQLRYDKGISYDGGVGIDTYNHDHAWSLQSYVTTDAQQVATANDVFATIFAKRGKEYDSDHIKAGLAMGKYGVLSSVESVDDHMDHIVSQLEYGIIPQDISEVSERLRTLTADDVRDTIDNLVDLAATQPRFEHRTGKRKALGKVDTIVDQSSFM